MTRNYVIDKAKAYNLLYAMALAEPTFPLQTSFLITTQPKCLVLRNWNEFI